MRKSTIVITAVGAALVGAIGTSVISSLHSHGDPAAGSQNSPSASTQFVTADEVPEAWRDATAAIHEPLPDGVVFPAQPPAFFDPDDPQTPEAFVPALPKQIAARWWRCAWIASARDAVPAQRVAATKRAESMVDRWYEMDGVKGDANFSDYDARMRAAADAAGESRLDVEYELDCGRLVFEEKGHS